MNSLIEPRPEIKKLQNLKSWLEFYAHNKNTEAYTRTMEQIGDHKRKWNID